nr:transposase [uncultured Cohaesibacter sp.]
MTDTAFVQLESIEIARLKKSCCCCENLVLVQVLGRPIASSLANAGLLAYILISKLDDHVPLYRLNGIFACMGADVPGTTLVDWCCRAMKVPSS